jgi:hypothetical protein
VISFRVSIGIMIRVKVRVGSCLVQVRFQFSIRVWIKVRFLVSG